VNVDVEQYLEQFGYLDSLGKRSGNPHQRQLARTKAIASFQDYAHLPVTGQLDEQTKEKMIAPRCGMTDVSKNKKNRASFYSKWDKDVITWKYIKPTNQLPNDKVRRAIQEAFAVWSKVIPLSFTEVAANQESDMQFAFGSRDHGDAYHFDGRGIVLAHAFFPKDGRLHFDDEELWTYENAEEIKGYQHTDLLSVAIHEMGHALGLDHLKDPNAIMYAFYRHPELDSKGQIKPFVLNQADISAIQEAYGPREGATARPTTPPPTPEPTPPGGSSGAACPRFQAAVTGPDGATYFFNGNNGWRKANAERDAPNAGTRFYLDRRFPNGPSYLSAAVTDKGYQRTFLFQGRRVWGYAWQSRDGKFSLDMGTGDSNSNWPKDLQNDVTFTPEGAFQLNGGHLILFAGDCD